MEHEKRRTAVPARFALTRYFSIASLVCTVVVAILLGWSYQYFALNDLKYLAEERNVALARAFRNSLWSEFAFLVDEAVNSPTIFEARARLNKLVANQMEGTDVIKVKIYAVSGMTVFSSDPSQIGQDQSGNSAFRSARGGTVASGLVRRDTFDAFEGTLSKIDVLETYLPIRDEQRRIVAVLEIYSDVTELTSRLVKTRQVVVGAVLGLLGLLYLMQYVLVVRAQRIIDRQKQLLEQSIHELDHRIHERTDSLAATNQSLLTEIDERRRAEVQLEEHQKNLEVLVNERTNELLVARNAADAASQAKSMFLANMSHEIRTPMNAVLGFAQLLQHDATLSPQGKGKVATILKSGEHLLSIINEILEMSRIEAGGVEVRSVPVDLHELLNEVTALFRTRAEETGLRLLLELAPLLPRHVLADLGKLRQILINLLGNAVKYTPSGAVAVRAFSEGHDRIAIEVEDSGIGVLVADQEKIFHPFERTRGGEMAAAGSGLGLAISRNFARLMGGDITLSSRPGEGSRFRLAIHAPVTNLRPVHSETPRRVTGLVAGQGDIHVLVVDDHHGNRQLLRDMLEPLGFKVDEAADGEEAVGMVNACKPRIVLMDLAMPGMDGKQATRVLRESPKNQGLVIIGVSAGTFEEDTRLFFDSGIDAHIGKPFREHEIYDALARHAGVLFETEGGATAAALPAVGQPPLDRMSVEWRAALRQALARGSLARVRDLADDIAVIDPGLAAWIQEHAARYDVNGLRIFSEGLDHQSRTDIGE